jgi:hypothetical protein
MAKQFSTKLIYHRCVYLFVLIFIHAFYSFSAWITSSVFLFSKFSPSSSSSISFSFSSVFFYLIKSIGLVCILVNIYPLGLTCYFFVSISCDASIVVTSSLFVTNPLISEATVVIKCTTYRTNTVDIPPDQKTSHPLFRRYSIPLQISDLTNNTQIHTYSLSESNFFRFFSICSRRIFYKQP